MQPPFIDGTAVPALSVSGCRGPLTVQSYDLHGYKYITVKNWTVGESFLRSNTDVAINGAVACVTRDLSRCTTGLPKPYAAMEPVSI